MLLFPYPVVNTSPSLIPIRAMPTSDPAISTSVPSTFPETKPIGRIKPALFKNVKGKSVSYNGYSIRKDELSQGLLEKIRDSLTVAPNSCPGYGADEQEPFKIYQENKNKIYLPRAYGYNHIGIPTKNKIHEGQPIKCEFNGSLRPYQESVLAAWDKTSAKCGGGGIIAIGAGRGKTVTAIAKIARLGVKTMVLVHTTDLLTQWIERLEQYLPTAEVGIIRGKKIQVTDKDVVIGMIQSLSDPRKDEEYPLSLFEEFGFVIIDECHHIGARMFSRCLRKTAFRYMMGLSATPDRQDGLTKVFKYYIGDICFKDTGIQKTDEEKLLDHIPDADVRVYEYQNYNPLYCKELLNYQKKPNVTGMETNMVSFMPRTEMILSLLPELVAEGRRIIILTSRRDHIAILLKLITERNIGTCGPYAGGLKQTILKDSKTKQILIATYKMAEEGFDHQVLDTLIMATPKKRIVQTAGRIMRKKKNDRKFVPLIIDILDPFSSFNRWFQMRMKYYLENNYRIARYTANDTRQSVGQPCLITMTQPPTWTPPTDIPESSTENSNSDTVNNGRKSAKHKKPTAVEPNDVVFDLS